MVNPVIKLEFLIRSWRILYSEPSISIFRKKSFFSRVSKIILSKEIDSKGKLPPIPIFFLLISYHFY